MRGSRPCSLVLLLAGCSIGTGPDSGSAAVTFGTPGDSSSSGGMTSDTADETDSATTVSATSTSGVDSSTGDPPPVGCGNGEVEDGEGCDDANDDPCDGCDACMPRTYLWFDGAEGSFAQIGDVPGAPLSLLDTPLTVEAWMRADGADDRVDIMRRGAGNTGWRLSLLPTAVASTVFSGFDHIAAGVAPPGSGWHHVAWTYDQVTSRLFLDGVEIDALAGTAPVLQTDAPLRLNAEVSGTGEVLDYAAGRIDEVRVSSVVRYIGPFEPARRHEPDGATVLLLHLDEAAGNDLTDASSHAHPGTMTGASWEPYDGYGGCG